MHKPLPLLASVLILLGLLGHHLHQPADAARAEPPQAVAPLAGASHAGLRIIDHGAVPDVDVEVCVPGGQVSHQAVTGSSTVAVLPAAVHGAAIHPDLDGMPAWLVPALPPDVLRAFLQVYLN